MITARGFVQCPDDAGVRPRELLGANRRQPVRRANGVRQEAQRVIDENPVSPAVAERMRAQGAFSLLATPKPNNRLKNAVRLFKKAPCVVG